MDRASSWLTSSYSLQAYPKTRAGYVARIEPTQRTDISPFV